MSIGNELRGSNVASLYVKPVRIITAYCLLFKTTHVWPELGDNTTEQA